MVQPHSPGTFQTTCDISSPMATQPGLSCETKGSVDPSHITSPLLQPCGGEWGGAGSRIWSSISHFL